MTLFIQIIIISFCLFINFKRIVQRKDKTLKYYFKYNICKFLLFKNNFNCLRQIYKNKNFYEYIEQNDKNINLKINLKTTKIENILILIGIIPFLKNNSKILYKINSKEIYCLFRKIFINKKIKNRIIKINENDFHCFIDNFNYLINYKWELIPDEDIINNIRYILNKYYNKSCIELFDKSLNANLKDYIDNKKNILSFKTINKLMSKLFFLIKYIIRKYWNI